MTKYKRAASILEAGTTATKKRRAVILTTGGLNPPHLGHVALLHQAKVRLERAGYAVLGMWISPSHDSYLQPKARSLGTLGLSAAFRLEVARRAVEDDPLVAAGAWEVMQVGRWPDFPVVTAALQRELTSLSGAETAPTVFYACGTDHAEKCCLYSKSMGPGRGVVVVPRSGEAAEPESAGGEPLVYVAEPAPGEVAAISSTKVREAIARKDHGYVKRAISARAADFMLQPSPEELSRFSADFALLGVGQQRKIYISLSSILRLWDRQGQALLEQIPENALFFFGSKRSWVFPANKEEAAESRTENAKYTSPTYQQIRELILEKEARDQVFFLKPPGFKYNGDLYHGDPAAFPKASKWLQRHKDPITGKAYAPLLLDPAWWETKFDPSTCKHTKAARSVVKNFQCGAHDYAPVMELLYQSNPCLDIVH